MSHIASTARRPGSGILSYAPTILAAILLAGCLPAAAPAGAEETGIRGTMLRGPIRGGPVRAGQPHEAPFRASFHVLQDGETMATFESDETGSFEVRLAPGRYVIVPDKSAPVLFPNRQGKDVTVSEDGYTRVTLRFDTGMR